MTLVENGHTGPRTIITEFKRLSPPNFERSTNPSKVDKWLQEMENLIELLGSSYE